MTRHVLKPIRLVILLLSATATYAKIVELEGLGSIEGQEEVARDGTRFYGFRGIPFAEPPTGIFRFRPAREVQPWEGVKKTVELAPPCPQMNIKNPTVMLGDEDCLYLNVFTKRTSPTAKKPVIVYIHGGAFIFGTAHRKEPKYLMEEDIVLVTIQYRLGPFGFLTTESKESPGNYGLHDVLMSLRWVNKHIESFGGDPDSVTIVGLSAGGAIVHYMLLSPNSAGLFHRAVSYSGSALCWWANLPNQRSTAKKLAASLSCPTVNAKEMLDCIREKPTEEIMTAQSKLYTWHPGQVEHEPMNIWSPRPDPEAGNTAILSIDPTLAMEAGQIQPVPFLVQVADAEGSWRAVNYLYQDDVMMEFLKDFENVAPLALGLKDQVDDGNMADVLKGVKRLYLDAMVTEKDLKTRLVKVVNGMVQMFGDTMFNYPIDRMVKLHANKDYAPVWLYVFNYKSNHSIIRTDLHKDEIKVPDPELKSLARATHGDEMFLLFPFLVEIQGELSEEETKNSRKFIKFMVEFAKKGVPTMDGKYEYKEWHPIKNGQITHFIFGKYSASQIGLPHQNRMKWWHNQPAFWRKDIKVETKAEDVEPSSEEEEQTEEHIEEISDEELEDLEVNKILEEMGKDEL